MIHLILHAAVPVAIALLFYRPRWKDAVIVMLGTMIVDIDHLLATPIYDPSRCSIGFHPLHTAIPIVLYGALFLVPLLARTPEGLKKAGWYVHIAGLGLLVHMVLDGIDCF